MTLLAYLTGNGLLLAGVGLGILFGILLHKGGVTDYNVIVNQFRLRDFTVVKIMLTAVVVGGIGVAILNGLGMANWHIKPADLLAVALGAAIFGVGMAVYGYCPGTGLAAIGTGSLHALAGFAGMLLGAAAYAMTYPWVKANILPVGSLGKVRLPEVLHVPEWLIYGILALGAGAAFSLIERRARSKTRMPRD